MASLKSTKLEHQIMDVLWTRGTASIREIQEEFPETNRPAYTTIQTTVYRLEAKRPAIQLNITKKLLLTAAGVIAVGTPFAFGSMTTKQSDIGPAFIRETGKAQSTDTTRPALTNKDTAVDLALLDVATIKQVPDSGPMNMLFSDDGVSFRGVAVAWIVNQAFSPQPTISDENDRILGLPSWTKSERYDIEAKVDDEDVPKWKALSLPQKRLALQPLLIKRFNLQFHHETRERPTYSLVVTRNGPKLHKAQLGETYPNGIRVPDSTGGHGAAIVTPGKIVLQGSSLSVLANLLSSQGLSHAVVDKTGLTGIYDITLRWSPDDMGSSDAPLPSLFTALQEQLGLKLEFNKNPVDVIVIDHIDKPSPN